MAMMKTPPEYEMTNPHGNSLEIHAHGMPFIEVSVSGVRHAWILEAKDILGFSAALEAAMVRAKQEKKEQLKSELTQALKQFSKHELISMLNEVDDE